MEIEIAERNAQIALEHGMLFSDWQELSHNAVQFDSNIMNALEQLNPTMTVDEYKNLKEQNASGKYYVEIMLKTFNNMAKPYSHWISKTDWEADSLGDKLYHSEILLMPSVAVDLMYVALGRDIPSQQLKNIINRL